VTGHPLAASPQPLLVTPLARRANCYLGRPSEGRGTAFPITTGEMAEWLKARAWKVRLPERVTGVRIPLSPPLHDERRSRSAECGGSEPSLLGRADSAFSRRPEGPMRCNEASSFAGKADEGGQSPFLHAGEPTVQMRHGPKGRRSAMKPSLTGKADEGGQSRFLHPGEPMVQMRHGPKGRQSAMKPSLTGKADEGVRSHQLACGNRTKRPSCHL